MSEKQKLELTWVNKDKRPKLEPRILIENPNLSYHADKRYSNNDIFDNILIQGDNLLALKALEQEYAGEVKCIYIDPPYNTGNAFEHYDDGLEHSIWLSLIRERLELLKIMLSDEGLIFIQIDDEEMPYLTILMDEIFGRGNRINIISVKMSEPSGVKMAHVKKKLPKLKEFILVYSKKRDFTIDVEYIVESKWNDEYKTIIEGLTKEELSELKNIISQKNQSAEAVNICNKILSKAYTSPLSGYFSKNNIPQSERNDWKFSNAWRIVQAVASSSILRLAKSRPKLDQEISATLSATGLIYLYKQKFNETAKQPRIQIIFADQNLSKNPGDFWSDIKTTGLDNEGGIDFKNGKKPEALIKRIIGMVTQEGDLVLDSFGGSGTTAAVAHKMGRRWIMVELGDHAETHIVQRLKKVIAGKDKGGVTATTRWEGGGGYRFYHLAPSLLAKDSYGHWVISKEYDANMLSAATCKVMGFTYHPSETKYWNHGYSSESDFIFVTTNAMTHDTLLSLSFEVGPDRSLLVCCKAFNTNPNSFNNLTLKKIPQAVLDKCEWGKDDYSLSIQNLPMLEGEDENNPSPFLRLEDDDA